MPPAVTIGLVGDVCLADGPATGAFAGVEPALAAADVVVGNCERPYPAAPAGRGSGGPGQAGPSTCPPGCHACELRRVGFDVLTCANNHVMDHGPEALRATLAFLGGHGLVTAGAGADRAVARRAVTVPHEGSKVAVVARTSVCRPGSEAGPTRAGVARLGVDTRYRQVEPDPGVPPRTETAVADDDLDELIRDVAEARRGAGVVVAAFHWGVKFLPHIVSDYERTVARAAIDAGADVVVGHHQHLLKGIDRYRGKPILYGIGNFLMPVAIPAEVLDRYEAEFRDRYVGFGLRRARGHPEYPFHPIGRMTAVVLVTVAGAGTGTGTGSGADAGPVIDVEMVPCMIGPTGLPAACDAASAPARRIWRHLREASRALGSGVQVALGSRDGVSVGRLSFDGGGPARGGGPAL